jgi:hypothetical protein
LAGRGQSRFSQQIENLLFRGAVENRRGDMDAFSIFVREL